MSLDERYFITVRVEVERGRGTGAARGAIDAEERAQVEPEALGLFRTALYRALADLDAAGK